MQVANRSGDGRSQGASSCIQTRVNSLMTRHVFARIEPTETCYDGAIVCCTGSGPSQKIHGPNDLIQHLRWKSRNQEQEVCVIQNISEQWATELSTALGISMDFFDSHWAVQNVTDLLKRTHDFEEARREPRREWHIDAFFEHFPSPRTLDTLSHPAISPDDALDKSRSEKPSVLSRTSTRISYRRVDDLSYLFLIGAPNAPEKAHQKVVDMTKVRNSETILRTRLSMNGRGLWLPQLLAQPSYNLMDHMKLFLHHRWHLSFLYAPSLAHGPVSIAPQAIVPPPLATAPQPLAYLLATSAWTSNVDYLRETINDVSFVEVPAPNHTTNEKLHNLREHLIRIQHGVSETLTWVPKGLESYFLDGENTTYDRPAVSSPIERLKAMRLECKDLQTFLMETFQILMSSLSTMDSQTSIQQSKRGTLVAVLATVYVPLSFVTGIFGMNVSEINGSPLSVWVCFATLAVVVLLTATAFILYRGVKKSLTGRRTEMGSIV